MFAVHCVHHVDVIQCLSVLLFRLFLEQEIRQDCFPLIVTAFELPFDLVDIALFYCSGVRNKYDI